MEKRKVRKIFEKIIYVVVITIIVILLSVFSSSCASPIMIENLTNQQFDESETEVKDEVIESVSDNNYEEVSKKIKEVSLDEDLGTEDETKRVVDTSKKLVALTFDDGPSKTKETSNTEDILNLLSEYDAVATFFEIGENIKKHPELILMEYEAGCEIGNHSYSHIDFVKSKKSYEDKLKEISDTNDLIYEITGNMPNLFRMPYMSINEKVAGNINMATILWSLDTNDYSLRNKDKIMKIIKEKDMESSLDGEVILMHSNHVESVETLKELLPYLTENGYQTVTVSELFMYRYNEEIEMNKIYGWKEFRKLKKKEKENMSE